jgi:hypothetical protein
MKSNRQKQKDKAFIAKLKTLQLSTSKSGKGCGHTTKCHCGGTVTALGDMMNPDGTKHGTFMLHRGPKGRRSSSDEQSLSA